MLNFIVNGKSGMGLGQKNIKKIMDYCFTHNIEYTVHITGAPGHATEIANALSTHYPKHTIVAVGGDGTFHEVLNGISDPKNVALGFIPSGRGNDYARAAKLNLNPIKALQAIVNNPVIYTDYINVDSKRCLNVSGTGLDIDVLQRVDGRKGKITYLISLISCLKNFKPYKVTVTINGQDTDYDCIMVGACNGVAIGGGMLVSPLSNINDGKIDVIIMTMPADGNLYKVLPKFKNGKHINLDITKHILCDAVKVISHNGKPVQIDGEIYSDIILDCKIAAGGLKTFKP